MSDDATIDTLVCIPARNEADRIADCLNALAAQRDRSGAPLDLDSVSILVLVNNSDDGTAAVARAWAGRSALRVEVRDLRLPEDQAHAGGARRAAMEAGAAALGSRNIGSGNGGSGTGILCSTDADSRVSPTWLIDVWDAFEGVDAVAGVVEFDPLEAASRHFPRARSLEDRYAALQAEVIACIDPEPHNPWPNHIWTWGANFAVTADAYRAVGGLPSQPLAEDRAFARALRRRDFKIRHTPDVRVVTSCRDQGRAPGGLADLIRTYAEDETYPCDAELEPLRTVKTRADLRRRLRSLDPGLPGEVIALAKAFGVAVETVEQAMRMPAFGERWSVLEEASPHLVRQRLRPTQLPSEIAEAEQCLLRLEARRASDRADTAGSALAGLWSGEGRRAR